LLEIIEVADVGAGVSGDTDGGNFFHWHGVCTEPEHYAVIGPVFRYWCENNLHLSTANI